MESLQNDLSEALLSDLSDITPQAREAVQNYLLNWLNNVARKKVTADTAERLADWQNRIRSLAGSVGLVLRRGTPVAVLSGNAEDTLRALDRGTDWFEPCEGVRDTLIALLLSA